MLRRFVSLIAIFLLGLLISISLNLVNFYPTLAQTPKTETLTPTSINIQQLQQQGREFYEAGRLEEAVKVWQQVVQAYQAQGDQVSQASVLSNLALAYQNLGQWQQAEQALTQSLLLLQQQQPSAAYWRVYAQALNNQGLLKFAKGEASQAFSSWEEAEKIYRLIGDNTGVSRSQVNQSLALQNLGLYPRACQLLSQVLKLDKFNCQNVNIETIEQRAKDRKILEKTLTDLPQQLDFNQVLAWRKFGNILRLNGKLDESKLVLESILQRTNLQEEKAAVLLNIGKVEQLKGNFSEALKLYQLAAETSMNTQTKTQAQLYLLRGLILTQQWPATVPLVREIEVNLNQLPINYTNLYANLNFIQSLTLLKKAEKNNNLNLDIPNWTEIVKLAENITRQAQEIGSKQAESYGLGTLGRLYEYNQQWATAEKLTQDALLIAQANNAPEIIYLWQWQMGRILKSQGKQEAAINNYFQAINTLQSIKNDLAAMSRELQFSFQEEIEPIYRQLVSLLLQPNQAGIVTTENLTKARDVLELLQVAQLDNFFQESCLVAIPKKIDEIDPQAAVIYPIILPDNLAIILSIPNQPLRYYKSSVKAEEVEKVIAQFRYELVVRSQRNFFSPGQQLYQWLIQPLESDLEASKVKTLVFVPDGALRNIPITALYDGKQYLIQKNYNIAITPGLNLLNPLSLKETNLLTLGGGITKARPGFPPLRYVQQELQSIQNEVPSDILLNEKFTSTALQQIIQQTPFPIVHLATHGQFSSNFEQTFILTWDERLNVNQLQRLLQQKSQLGQTAIELLVLSACETASGDKQAALGLAGMAVRSGARSTLATFWSVNDEATAEFMSQFYGALATKKLTKAEAFRQAQLSLLQNSRYQHPFYWSPYVLVGNWL